MKSQTTRCCIAGGGPAGMMLGLLIARAGVPVMALEKHNDFLRDFRGDTVHPSTLEIMHELGLLAEFLRRPHQEARQIRGFIGGSDIALADFTHLPTICKFIALMPQWKFPDFLAQQARAYPHFQLAMNATVQSLITEQGRVMGVKASTPDGPLEVRADLVVGTDGRGSTLMNVAAANLLAGPLRRGHVTNGDLARVQRRRWLPTVVTQRLQVFIQNRVIGRVLASPEPFAGPDSCACSNDSCSCKGFPPDL